MYITPSPMSPDTFSQYGYADAVKLRALRRGYGHDIYPQYPTTYNMPRVVSGLGAFTHKGYTVDYYANKGTLSFADKNLQRLYEGMRNADIEFQKNAAFVLNGLKPAFDTIEFASAGQLKAADVRSSLSLKLPTWGVALVLEVAAGKRPVDQAFRAAMRQCARDMRVAKAGFAVLTGLNVVVSGVAVATGVGAPVAAATGTIAGVAGTAAAVAAVLEPIFQALADGKAPSQRQMKAMMDGAARLSKQKLPSNAQVEKITVDFGKALSESAKKVPGQAEALLDEVKQGVSSKALTAAPPSTTKALPPQTPSSTMPSPSEKEEESTFPLVPVVAGLGVLAAVVFVVARKRGGK